MRIFVFIIIFIISLSANEIEDGLDMFAKGDYKKSFKILKKNEDKQHPQALYTLGFMYVNGFGVKQDYYEGYKNYKLAASFGYGEAIYALGSDFFKNRDYETALLWFKKGASLNNNKCAYAIAYMYDRGEGVARNSSKAKYWYKKAGFKN